MSLILLLFCVKNLRVEMGYELIITIMIFGDFEPSWARWLKYFRAFLLCFLLFTQCHFRLLGGYEYRVPVPIVEDLFPLVAGISFSCLPFNWMTSI